jgi:SAM-dependent methyltransferase
MSPDASPDPYDAIAPWYDLEHADITDDIAMYAGFIAATGGPVLELGCGSGRVLVPLAEEGYTITGIDRSAVMLSRCQAAAEAAGVTDDVTLVRGDMTDFDLGARRFRFAFVALGSFQHLATLGARRTALARLRMHVLPGATLVLDLAHGDLRRVVGAAETGQVLHITTRRDPQTDAFITHTLAAQMGAEPATLALTHWYDRHPQGGVVERVCIETEQAVMTRAEVELLLSATGWRLRHLYGDHALGEWDEASPRLIAVAQAAEG